MSGTAYTGNMSQDLVILTKQALSSQGEHIRSVTNTPKRNNASYNWGEFSESRSAFCFNLVWEKSYDENKNENGKLCEKE